MVHVFVNGEHTGVTPGRWCADQVGQEIGGTAMELGAVVGPCGGIFAEFGWGPCIAKGLMTQGATDAMAEMTERCWEIFLEVFAALPRQGPGNRECAARALGLCRDLPPAPSILDLGCGIGGQTLHLAELTAGSIIAVDNHAPWIALLEGTIAKHGLTDRIQPTNDDIASLPFESESFDLIWSEGALYCIGIEPALRICRRLLRAGGYLAFTDAVWKKTNPPAEVLAMFERDYPEMGWAEDILTKIKRCDFDLVAHFTLPDKAWWDDFYTPMEACANSLKPKYAEDGEALESLALVVEEIELHKKHSEYYAYEFFVARKPVQ